MRYPEQPSSGRSRFGVRRCPPALVRTNRTALVAPAVFRLTNAMRGSSMCGLVVCGFARLVNAPHLRRLNECACNRLVSCRSCGRSSVQPIDHSLTSDPAYQAPPLRTFVARHRSCTADCSIPVFRYRFGPSRPGPALGPSLGSPGNAPGVHQRPSQACSRIG
jgi:hypothetical protein